MQNLPPSDPVLDERLRLIVESLPAADWQAAASPDVPRISRALRAAVWNAPFAIVAHGTEDDPIFFYGNRFALQLFEMNFEEFARLPSRLSAEPLAQEARVKSAGESGGQGYIDGYSGMRIASSGRRFMITARTIWNLVDEAGVHHGQAAVFVAED